MEYFLKVIKSGKYVIIKDKQIKMYLENIDVEKSDKSFHNYGNSVEIELWIDKPQSADIAVRKKQVITEFNLMECKQQTLPVQEFAYQWQQRQQVKNP
jgi:hypothetical protein